MRRSTCCFTMLVVLACGTRVHGEVHWKLILKDGSVVECAGAPLMISGVYTFRQPDGNYGSLAVDQVDQEKTNQANKVDRTIWREKSGAATATEPPRAAAVPTSGSMVRSADFRAQVLESPTPVLVEFWASWCGYCRHFEPTLRAVAGEYAGRVAVFKVDIDRSPDIAKQYGGLATPTVMLFKEGKVAGVIVGDAPKDRVVRMLERSL